jgi:hypothetical protein
VEGEQIRDASRSAEVPRDIGRDGASFEDGEHVLDPVCVLWVLLQDVKKSRVQSGVEYATAAVMVEHPLVPKDIYAVHWSRNRRSVHGKYSSLPGTGRVNRIVPPSYCTLSESICTM